MIRALTKPTRLMLGVAAAAAVANAIAFAASADIAGGADEPPRGLAAGFGGAA
ncbi:hypothetical protein ACFSLT_04970 [Novosphingobium resinovorum]